jgi:hypothetical protein
MEKPNLYALDQNEIENLKNLLLDTTDKANIFIALRIIRTQSLAGRFVYETAVARFNHDLYGKDTVFFGEHVGRKISELSREELIGLVREAERINQINGGNGNTVEVIYRGMLRRAKSLQRALKKKAGKYEDLIIHFNVFQPSEICPLGFICFVQKSVYLPIDYVFGWDYGKISDNLLLKMWNMDNCEGNIIVDGQMYSLINIESFFSEGLDCIVNDGHSIKDNAVCHDGNFICFVMDDVEQEAARRKLALPVRSN